MADPLKLSLFIDAQNAYRGARTSFFTDTSPSVSGQFNPAKLATLIETRVGPENMACILSEVRVYTGRPEAVKDPKTYAAYMKQCAEWSRNGVTIVHRALRYSRGWPTERAQEKGIDTALAIDFVTMAVDGLYDIGVIMSTDTDLVPALEFVRTRFAGQRHVAVAAWRSQHSRRRLSIPGANVWCHWLNQDDYGAVADLTDYNR